MKLLFDNRLGESSKNAFLSGLCFVVCFAFFCLSVTAQNIEPNEREFSLSSGNPNAVVKIEVFYDLQCGSCARFHSILRNVEDKYQDKVFVTFRHFPLRIHDKSFLAAKIVEAAHVQGKGRKMLDMVLANQTKWRGNPRAESIFFNYARKLRLNMVNFRCDFENEEMLHKIVGDMLNAKTMNLIATPTVFVNEKQLSFVEALEIETEIKELVK